jgi:hypothetical protein
MMEAVRNSETSVYFYETKQCNAPEGCYLLSLYYVRGYVLDLQRNLCLVEYVLVVLSGAMVSMLAIGPMGRGFKPGLGR